MAERESSKKTKRLATCALLTTAALIFSYVEFLIPLPLPVPGIKLGLANIVIVIALYKLSPRHALIINLTRICLSALLFGNAFSAVYALCGGLLSFAAMLLLKKPGIFSPIGISMGGGVVHNFGQILAAAALMKTVKILNYFPVLTIAGLITGLITGFIAALSIRSLKEL